MTFLEAAIEVLRREGKPANVRRLVDQAVKLNLLSVVGRDPERTMEDRLSDAMQSPDPRRELVMLEPGVYGLKNYPARPYPEGGAAEAPSEPAAERPAGANGPGRRRRRRGGAGPAADATAAEPTGGAEEAEGGEAEPSGDEPAEGAVATTPEGAAGDEAGAKRRRRRRGGRGRRRGRDRASTPGEAPVPGAAADAGAADDDGDEVESADAMADEAQTAGEAAPARKSPRDQNVASEPDLAGESNVASEPDLAGESNVASEPGVATSGAPQREDAAGAQAGAGGATDAAFAPDTERPVDELLEDEGEDAGEHEFDLPTGPLMAPSHGAEELVRGDDERAVRAEIPGRRSEERGRRSRQRGRSRRDEPKRAEGQRNEPGRNEPRRDEPRRDEPRRDEPRRDEPRRDEPRRDEPRRDARDHDRPRPNDAARPDSPSERGGLVDAAVEILRAEGGRPLHVRHLTDLALKRRLVDGAAGAGDIARQMRIALLRHQREREEAGLRPRIRGTGGGQFVLAERKLDGDLAQVETELANRVERLREATRTALRRRLERLPPPAFEMLGRLVAEKLGVTGLELVRRGEGVAYFGGTRAAGTGTVRALIAVRPGEGEITRRAVGELRAGLPARGYEWGLLLAAGRPNPEALAELKAAPGVEMYDGQSLAALCARLGVGVRRALVAVEYLDADLLAELSEG